MPKGMPKGVIQELEDLFDRCVRSPGGVIRYNVSTSRAKYLLRWAKYIKVQSAIESVQMYSPGDKQYARGLYWNIKVLLTQEGLYFVRVSQLELSKAQILFEAAFRGEDMVIEKATEEAADRVVSTFRVLRDRILRKYPLVEELSAVQVVREGTEVVIFASAMNSRLVTEVPSEEARRIKQIFESQDEEDFDTPDTDLPDRA